MKSLETAFFHSAQPLWDSCRLLQVSVIPFGREVYSVTWVCPTLFIHSPVEGHMGGFQPGVIMNRAAIIIQVKVFV